jgi:molybdopterin molybdotransferase
MRLLTVEDARARMLAAARPLPIEIAPLAAAQGRMLAEAVLAGRPQPPFAASAMDGWAVRAADGVAPRRIVGESAAGHGYDGALGPGDAVRIFTGAAVPEGADTVVIQEEARRDGEALVFERLPAASSIRRAALDFAAGDLLLGPGVRLDPWRLALAAAAGRASLAVARRPEVVVLATGEEVVAPGGAPGPFQIFDSGTTALGALVAAWGGRATALAAAGDDEAEIAGAVAGASGDLIVTLGGASVGDHDLVKPALTRLGLVLSVASVAVRPGKPTWFGVLADGRLVLGLPGNPASAMVCAELFLRPLMQALQGADPAPRVIRAPLVAGLPANGEREHWMRARWVDGADGRPAIRPMPDQDSSLVGVFAEADALVRRPPNSAAAAPGDLVDVLPLGRLS